jgi:hypothetical protein
MTATRKDDIILTQGSTQVTIAANDAKENRTNTLSPKSIPSVDVGVVEDTVLINLNMVEKRYTVSGFLVNGYGSGDTSSTARGKRDDFRTIFQAKGLITLNFDGDEFSVMLEKMEVKVLINDGLQDLYDGEAEYEVTFTAIEGEDTVG